MRVTGDNAVLLKKCSPLEPVKRLLALVSRKLFLVLIYVMPGGQASVQGR